MTFCGFSQEAVLQGLANTSKLSQLGAAALWGSRLALSGMFLCTLQECKSDNNLNYNELNTFYFPPPFFMSSSNLRMSCF